MGADSPAPRHLTYFAILSIAITMLLATYFYPGQGVADGLQSSHSHVDVYNRNISIDEDVISDGAGAILRAPTINASSLHLKKQRQEDESFLVYYHVPKAGGTSFDRMFQKKFRGVESSERTKNCGLLRSCCEPNSKVDRALDRILKTCDHFTYEGHMPLFKRISMKNPNARLLIRKKQEAAEKNLQTNL